MRLLDNATSLSWDKVFGIRGQVFVLGCWVRQPPYNTADVHLQFQN